MSNDRAAGGNGTIELARPEHYWRELRSGNVRTGPFIAAVALALFNSAQRKLGGAEVPYREPTDRKTTPKEELDLQSGDIVRVKTRREIEGDVELPVEKSRAVVRSRNASVLRRGVSRVASVVRTIVDEGSGKLLTMGSACIVLAGVSATGEYLGLAPERTNLLARGLARTRYQLDVVQIDRMIT